MPSTFHNNFYCIIQTSKSQFVMVRLCRFYLIWSISKAEQSEITTPNALSCQLVIHDNNNTQVFQLNGNQFCGKIEDDNVGNYSKGMGFISDLFRLICLASVI